MALDDRAKEILGQITELPSGCWVSSLAARSDGYVRVAVHGEKSLLHRYLFKLLVSDLPDDITLDHICMNRSCCNPKHLEPVTTGVNQARSPNTLTGINIRKTHCPKQHEYNDKNTRVYRGKRYCRVCDNIRTKQRGTNGS